MQKNNPGPTTADIHRHFQLFKDGEGLAFKFFYDLYNRQIYVFILNLLHSDAIAEEITNDVFVLLWDDRDKINDPHHLSGFLYLVARRQTIAHLVKLKRQTELEATWAKYQYEWATQFDEVEIVKDKIITLIIQHIDTLPPKQKEVFLLNFTQRMDVRSIAEKLGTSEKNVYKHLAKAYEYFKNLLQTG
jgi:RNA polymerase sigma factor (sigma-70 family)